MHRHSLVVTGRLGRDLARLVGNPVGADYSRAEIPHLYDGNGFSEKYLLSDALAADATQTKSLDCPRSPMSALRPTATFACAIGPITP